MAAAKDLTGQRFGRLTVVGPAELEKPRANGQRLGWRCRSSVRPGACWGHKCQSWTNCWS